MCACGAARSRASKDPSLSDSKNGQVYMCDSVRVQTRPALRFNKAAIPITYVFFLFRVHVMRFFMLVGGMAKELDAVRGASSRDRNSRSHTALRLDPGGSCAPCPCLYSNSHAVQALQSRGMLPQQMFLYPSTVKSVTKRFFQRPHVTFSEKMLFRCSKQTAWE